MNQLLRFRVNECCQVIFTLTHQLMSRSSSNSLFLEFIIPNVTVKHLVFFKILSIDLWFRF